MGKKETQAIQEAVNKAKQLYRKGNHQQALKVLSPYKDNPNIAAIMKRISSGKAKRRKKAASRASTNSLVGGLLGIVIVVGILVIILGSHPTRNDKVTENPQIEVSPTPVTYYAKHNDAVLRTCQQNDCPILDILDFGQPVQVIDTVEGGEMGGLTTWYKVNVDGLTGYVHAAQVLTSPPPTPLPPAPAYSANSSSGSSSQGNCYGDQYNCRDFSSCSEVMSYWKACPGDPSNLDGDGDGRPCEDRCG